MKTKLIIVLLYRQINQLLKLILWLSYQKLTVLTKGVVGWVDLKSDELEGYLNIYKNKDIIKGFRHVVQDESDLILILSPSIFKWY